MFNRPPAHGISASPFLAHYLPDDRQLRLGIATAITQIDSSVVRPAFAAAPALEIEFEKRLERYGRFT